MIKKVTPIWRQINTIILNRKSKTPILTFPISYQFSLRNKKTQLILHQQESIEKMHDSYQRQSSKHKKSWEAFHQKQDNSFRISLVGLPNSGKSTLFNCLIGQRLAVVDKLAGMTRDRKQYTINEIMTFIDTPGVQLDLSTNNKREKLQQDIFMQTIYSLHESHLIIFVVDSKKSISEAELNFSNYLRKFGEKANIIVACNKCDGSVSQQDAQSQASKLGFNHIFLCSGQQGTGIFQLINFIRSKIPVELMKQIQQKRKKRIEKFEQLLTKLKQQLQLLMKDNKTKINLKQWQRDFKKINPNPQDNEDLDLDNFQDHFIKPNEAFSNSRGASIKNLRMKQSIKISIIGRPNVGKSSLINQLIGQNKILVSQTPHTTRDPISSKIMYKNRKIELIDTAGLNTPNFNENQQYLKKVQISTMIQVKQSHVVVYIMDAFSAFKIDDFTLIQKVLKEGRPILIAVNKWEAIKDQYKYKAKNYLKNQIQKNLGQLNGDPLVFISVKMNIGLQEMMDKIITIYDKWNTRISTGLLNNWLTKFKKLDNLPKADEKALKINYIIQARIRPPVFVFFVNNKSLFKDNYMRFVKQNFAKEFQMDGVPIRTILRSTNNKQNSIRKSKDRKNGYMRNKMEDLKKKYKNFGFES